jgi:hypothetical protein
MSYKEELEKLTEGDKPKETHENSVSAISEDVAKLIHSCQVFAGLATRQGYKGISSFWVDKGLVLYTSFMEQVILAEYRQMEATISMCSEKSDDLDTEDISKSFGYMLHETKELISKVEAIESCSMTGPILEWLYGSLQCLHLSSTTVARDAGIETLNNQLIK